MRLEAKYHTNSLRCACGGTEFGLGLFKVGWVAYWEKALAWTEPENRPTGVDIGPAHGLDHSSLTIAFESGKAHFEGWLGLPSDIRRAMAFVKRLLSVGAVGAMAIQEFTVYTPAINLGPGEVHNFPVGPVALPDWVKSKYAGRPMGVIKFQLDIVRKEDGKEVRVPLNEIYNHHNIQAIGTNETMTELSKNVAERRPPRATPKAPLRIPRIESGCTWQPNVLWPHRWCRVSQC